MSDAPGVKRGPARHNELVRALAETPETLAAMLDAVSDSALSKAEAGEWSPLVVAAHLRDDEFMVMRLRLERMLVEDAPLLTPFDEQGWAATRWAGRDGVDDLLADLRMQRAASLHILTRLTDEQWLRLGTQPEIGTFDIAWWVEHWAEHDADHLNQISVSLGLAD